MEPRQKIVRTALTGIAFLLLIQSVEAKERKVDVTMPLVEEALRFLRNHALFSVPEEKLLRAGAVQVCGGKLARPGCRPPGMQMPKDDATGPDASRAWRRILESSMASEIISKKAKFDKTAFQRYVMNGMVEALGDPSSFYLTPSVYRKIASIPEDFVGFGLVTVAREQSLDVAVVHPDSPANASGVVPGERIVKVNGLPVTGYHRPLALAAIWGADGRVLKLVVENEKGQAREVEVKYRPWKFNPYSVKRKANAVIVVRIRHFAPGLVDSVRKALTAPLKGVVFDLRNASGGDEEVMSRLADLLLSDGEIGSQRARTDIGSKKWKAVAGSPNERTDLSVAVVVNRGTSGIAELFACAMRNHERAVLVGGPTGGLDTLETIRRFSDGSAIQVTSTRLFGPDDTPLSSGVLPHVKTNRIEVTDLAVEIVRSASGCSIEKLIEAARKATDAKVK